MATYPKFQKKISEQITSTIDQGSKSTFGIILDYNDVRNTASVLVAHPGSDEPGEAFYNVPCPTTIGVQHVAPLPGRPCWIVFKDSTITFPMIVAFFNTAYEDIDYKNQTFAVNNTPRYMFSM